MPIDMEDVKLQLHMMRARDGPEKALSLYCINRLKEEDIPLEYRLMYQGAKSSEEKQKVLRSAYSAIAENLRRRGIRDPDKVGLVY